MFANVWEGLGTKGQPPAQCVPKLQEVLWTPKTWGTFLPVSITFCTPSHSAAGRRNAFVCGSTGEDNQKLHVWTRPMHPFS